MQVKLENLESSKVIVDYFVLMLYFIYIFKL